jgi:transcriptional regulator with XRE-family HTH domain
MSLPGGVLMGRRESEVLDPELVRQGKVFRELRRRRGLTGEQLAALSGVSEPQISVVERGKQRATRRHCDLLAPALQVGALWLQSVAGYVVSDEPAPPARTLDLVVGALMADGRVEPEDVSAVERIVRRMLGEHGGTATG